MRPLLVLTGVLAAGCFLSAPSLGRSTLGVEVPGAGLAHALRQVWSEQTGSRLPAVGISSAAAIPAGPVPHGAAGSAASLLLLPNASTLQACRDGLLRPMDWARVGPRSAYAGASDCGLPGYDSTLVLAWDQSRDPTPPGWPEFWDVARFPGKRGLPRQARGTLEVALMADGVKTGDVYRVLGSSGGAARAFRKLDQLRPYLAWWTDGDAARRALTSRAVMMTLAPAAFDEPSAPTAKGGSKSNVGRPIVAQQWSQSLTEMLSWAMPNRTGDVTVVAALSFLAIEQDPLFQAAVTRLTPVLGDAPGARAVLSPDLLARTQAAPGRRGTGLRIDDVFWRDHGDLSARFDAWLASPPR